MKQTLEILLSIRLFSIAGWMSYQSLYRELSATNQKVLMTSQYLRHEVDVCHYMTP